jgi:hypothetical protein
MTDIKIEWLSDYIDCETCGGNDADGARVTIDGFVALELIPHAHCFGGDHWDERAVYRSILEHLGYTVTEGDAA